MIIFRGGRRGARTSAIACVFVGTILMLVPFASGEAVSESPYVSSDPKVSLSGSSSLSPTEVPILVYRMIRNAPRQEVRASLGPQNGSASEQSSESQAAGLDLSGINVRVVEDYPAFVAAIVDEEAIIVLESRGHHVEPIPMDIGFGKFRHDFRMPDSMPDELRLDWSGEDRAYPFLVKFVAPPRTAWILAMRTKAVQVLGDVGDWTYYARMQTSTAQWLSDLPYMGKVEPYHYGYRLSETLLRSIGPGSIASATVADLEAFATSGTDCTSFREGLEAAGGEVVEEYVVLDSCVARARFVMKDVPGLLRIDSLLWVDFVPPPATTTNDQAVGIVQSGQPGLQSVFDHGIRGSGQLIAMMDTGLDAVHAAFADPEGDPIGDNHRKVQAYVQYSDGVDGRGHGTHVAGTIFGDEPPYWTSNLRDGNAIGARIVVHDIGTGNGPGVTPPAMTAAYQDAYDRGARVHTNSWGSGGNNCNDRCLDTDAFMRDNPEFLVLFSAGNAGPPVSTITREGNAKNIVTVGATGNGVLRDDMALGDNGVYFSSRGPAGDGRLKPTVVSPGQDIVSALAAGTTMTDCQNVDATHRRCDGTSMATPAVAGAAALVREYFIRGFYPTGLELAMNSLSPSGALVKGVLIASAQEIGGADTHVNPYVPPGPNPPMQFPNNDQGWGRVLLDNALYFDGDRRRLLVVDERRGLSQPGEWLDYSFFVGDNSEPVKVTLVWTDPAALLANCNPCLRNDLNLEVTDPLGQIFRGNFFAGANPGQSVQGGNFDNTNVEEVVLRIPAAGAQVVGRWRVRVIAQGLPVAPQPFALVVTGALTNEIRVMSGLYSHSNPSISSNRAAGGSADTHIVWTESGGGSTSLWYARYDQNGVGTNPMSLDQASDLFGPVTAVGPDNVVYVAYARWQDAWHYEIRGKKSLDGGTTWVNFPMPPLWVYTSSYGPIVDRSDPIDMVVSSSNEIHLVFAQFQDNGPTQEQESVIYARSSNGGQTWTWTWLYIESYAYPGYDHYNKVRFPKVAKGRNLGPTQNYVHVLLSYDYATEPLGGPFVGLSEVRYKRSLDNGQSWTVSYAMLGHTGELARENDLSAREERGNVVAVWHDLYLWAFDIQGVYSGDDGGTWSASGFLPSGSGNQGYPAIDMDNSGFVHMVYTSDTHDGVAGSEEVYIESSLDGGAVWLSGGRVTFFVGQSTTPAIALNLRGTFEVAWSDSRGGPLGIYYESLPVPNRVTYQSASSSNPGLAIDAGGRADMVWTDQRNGDSDVYFAQYSKDGKPLIAERRLTDAGDYQFGPVIAISYVDLTVYVAYARWCDSCESGWHYELAGKKSTDGGTTWVNFPLPPIWIYTSHYRAPSDWSDPIDMVVTMSNEIHLAFTQFAEPDPTQQVESLIHAKSSNGGASWTWTWLYTESYNYPGYDHYSKVRFPKVAKGQNLGPTQNYVHLLYSYDYAMEPLGGPFVGPGEIRYLRSLDDGLSWQPFTAVGTTRDLARENDLVADENGFGVIAVWHDWVTVHMGFDVLYARSLDHGQTWLPVGTVAGVSGIEERYPAAARDWQGNVHIVYSVGAYSGDNTLAHRALLIGTRTGSPSWSDTRGIALPLGGPPTRQFWPAAATRSGGDWLYVGWQDSWGSSSGWTEVYLMRVF